MWKRNNNMNSHHQARMAASLQQDIFSNMGTFSSVSYEELTRLMENERATNTVSTSALATATPYSTKTAKGKILRLLYKTMPLNATKACSIIYKYIWNELKENNEPIKCSFLELHEVVQHYLEVTNKGQMDRPLRYVPDRGWTLLGDPSGHKIQERCRILSDDAYKILTKTGNAFAHYIHDTNAAFCVIEDDQGSNYCFEQFGDIILHAELIAAEIIRMYSTSVYRNTTIRNVTLYLHAFPCYTCCSKIAELFLPQSLNKPEHFNLKLDTMGYHYKKPRHAYFKNLVDSNKISVELLNEKDKQFLEEFKIRNNSRFVTVGAGVHVR